MAIRLPRPLPGRVADRAFIRRLGLRVAERGGVLHQSDEAELRILLVNPRARALFASSPKRPKIYLACDATRFEAMHEYFHLLHHHAVGRADYRLLTTLQREQEVFNRMVASPIWDACSPEERQGAVRYLTHLGGDAISALRTAKDQIASGGGGIDFEQGILA